VSTNAKPLAMALEQKNFREIASAPHAAKSRWDVQGYAGEQIRGLIQKVFLSGQPDACRQVVFSAADPIVETGGLCREVAKTLAELSGKQVCLALASGVIGNRGSQSIEIPGGLRDSARRLSSGLYLLSREVFWSGEQGFSADVPRRRLDQLREEFDYSVIQAPAAAADGTAALLGRWSDGLVLVVEANSTHRAAARKTLSILHAAHIRMLGIVLSERTFPIPEKLYRRL